MKKILLASFLLISFLCFGQCPTDNIYLLTQLEVDEFSIIYPNCTHLQGSLTVREYDVTNLNGLSQIQDVEQGLTIRHTSIQDLSGLENIQNLSSSLIITDNSSLTSFNGLQNLETIYGQFAIAWNNQITDLNGFDSLTTVGEGTNYGLLISANDNLISFAGLESLTSLYGVFEIHHNDSLLDFTGFDNLNSIYGFITVFDNDSLETFHGLENLSYCEDYLSITDNASLVSIAALNGFGGTEFVGVYIEDNPQLPYCSIVSVCDAIDDPIADVAIFNNAAGCNSVPEVEAQCDLTIADVDLSKQLSVFPNPASEMLFISASEGITVKKATIYSLLGAELMVTSEDSVDVSNLSEGIYIIKINTNQGTITKKVLIE
ncbi:T9SS type A sorting domain-containing protein [Ulvibacter antarcticus]|uniref:Putative secreted protein (Por secretion system target) n=1 Tax=Ulvibacter antarcticus TaxID=442714 RepID=A0A3L9YC98_9FLAO|nr:T9SS type A sorting domain-containing protein [Ulvibacter antarcticus]RMA57117.1 putative secreted protein (Por secretion system target) [Ulvibacter antarcticus]